MAPTDDHAPGDLSFPPDDLASRELPLSAVTGPWWRVHSCHRTALYFGRQALNRFDAPAGEYGVLYAAQELHGAFIETYGQKLDLRAITPEELTSRCASVVRPARPCMLVDVTGPGLARLGADERLNSGSHRVARIWSRAFWAHPSRPDGILYRARHDPERLSVALYERAESFLTSEPRGPLLGMGATTFAILDHYGFALLGALEQRW